MAVPAHLHQVFLRLVDADCQQTSPQDRSYNCIGFAAEPGRRRFRQWWPFPGPPHTFWPRGVQQSRALASFEAAFATLGYQPGATDLLEPGVEKVALFVDHLAWVTHAALQLPDGIWTSKLGALEDIRHPLRQLEGFHPAYGTVASILSRPRPGAPPPAVAPPLPAAPPAGP